MTTLATKFKEAASKVINTFAEDTGVCTYKSLTTATSYEPHTGVSTPVYDVDSSVKIAFGAITDEATFPEHFTNNHVKAYISGETFTFVPKEGDLIILSDGTTYLLDNGFTVTDMYKALFTTYVKEVFV